MAERVAWYVGVELHLPMEWPRVWVKPKHNAPNRDDDSWIVEIVRWIEDDDRPGEYGVRYDDMIHGYADPICLAFSDPTLAFETKMRWG